MQAQAELDLGAEDKAKVARGTNASRSGAHLIFFTLSWGMLILERRSILARNQPGGSPHPGADPVLDDGATCSCKG